MLRFTERPEFAKAFATADKFWKFGLDERDPAKLAPEAPQPNDDQQTGHGRTREADAAHARSSPFLSAISGRYISDGENRRLFSL